MAIFTEAEAARLDALAVSRRAESARKSEEIARRTALLPPQCQRNWEWLDWASYYWREPQGRKRIWKAKLKPQEDGRYELQILSYESAWSLHPEQCWTWMATNVHEAVEFAEAWLAWRRSPRTWREGTPEPQAAPSISSDEK